MGATVHRHLQKTQYLRHWKTGTGAGAWTDNTDTGGHAAACIHAWEGDPKGLSCAQYKGMNSRCPTSDIQHLRNHCYDPAVLASKQTWAREVIDMWMASCEDDVANAVEKALSGACITGIGTTQRGDRPVGAKDISGLALWLSQTDVQWEHIGTSLQTWRVETDPAAGPNCSYSKEPDTSAHYMHFCRKPTVAAARGKHLRLLVTVIHTYQLKPSTANALTAMYFRTPRGGTSTPAQIEQGPAKH